LKTTPLAELENHVSFSHFADLAVHSEQFLPERRWAMIPLEVKTSKSQESRLSRRDVECQMCRLKARHRRIWECELILTWRFAPVFGLFVPANLTDSSQYFSATKFVRIEWFLRLFAARSIGSGGISEKRRLYLLKLGL
jgi:hypothetical protein